MQLTHALRFMFARAPVIVQPNPTLHTANASTIKMEKYQGTHTYCFIL